MSAPASSVTPTGVETMRAWPTPLLSSRLSVLCEIRVARDEKGVFRPLLTIARQPAMLERIFVATVEHGPKPSVRYVDLFGVAVSGNKPVTERITP